MERPGLTFACELDTRALSDLFADEALVVLLTQLRSRVSLGLVDLSAERAAVVRRLNEAGVPVVAWILLSPADGYWCNAANGPQAVARYAALRVWTAEHGLRWAGIGIDIEPDLAEVQALIQGRIAAVAPRLLRRLFDGTRLRRAAAIYTTLVLQMHLDGYRVESYHVPFIVDERRVGATLLQRALGLVDVPTDREVLMLYTSLMGASGPGLLWSYGQEAEAIGVGSTGGGVELGVEAAPLAWPAFARDLRVARQLTDQILVFSLEGCVQQGFLSRLLDFDWDAPVAVPMRRVQWIDGVRRMARAVLWASVHPALILGSGAALAGLIHLLVRWKFRSRPASTTAQQR